MSASETGQEAYGTPDGQDSQPGPVDRPEQDPQVCLGTGHCRLPGSLPAELPASAAPRQRLKCVYLQQAESVEEPEAVSAEQAAADNRLLDDARKVDLVLRLLVHAFVPDVEPCQVETPHAASVAYLKRQISYHTGVRALRPAEDMCSGSR